MRAARDWSMPSLIIFTTSAVSIGRCFEGCTKIVPIAKIRLVRWEASLLAIQRLWISRVVAFTSRILIGVARAGIRSRMN